MSDISGIFIDDFSRPEAVEVFTLFPRCSAVTRASQEILQAQAIFEY